MTGYAVKLSLRVRNEVRDGTVWCPAIDAATQAPTKQRVFEGLGEAVELWFESCVSRGVLDQALQESGFRRVCGATPAQDASDRVTVGATLTPDQAISVPAAIRFQISEERGDDFLEGFIPALLAEDDLGSYFCPTHSEGASKRGAWSQSMRPSISELEPRGADSGLRLSRSSRAFPPREFQVRKPHAPDRSDA